VRELLLNIHFRPVFALNYFTILRLCVPFHFFWVHFL
jgi:hypothetical protein